MNDPQNNLVKKPKIVILGAGFAGIYTYLSLVKRLKKDEADILIIDRTNYFLFTPMLHEVATGGLSHHQVVESIREIIYKTCADLFVANIEEIDTKQKQIKTSAGFISYDYLVVALGATTNYYDIEGAQENTFVLKDLAQAIKLRNHFISVFESASHVKDQAERKKMLSFAVVGGGATGVELAAEMADLFFNTFNKYYKGIICKTEVTLSLIHKESDLLPMFDQSLRKKSLEVLREKGVRVFLDTTVESITKDLIEFSDGETLLVRNIIWAAGVKPYPILFSENVGDDIRRDKSERIIVDRFLRVEGFNDIYALGDIASFTQNEKPVPMLAQVAVQEGRSVGKNIVRSIRGLPLTPFIYKYKGDLVSLGQWQAVGKIFGITWTGPFAWWLWRTVYLFNFASWPKRIKIAVDWTINIFYPRDITKA